MRSVLMTPGAARFDRELIGALQCPADGGDLRAAAEALRCAACDARYPVADGVVRFVDAGRLGDEDRREQAARDAESAWYDSMFEGYTNAVEIPTMLARIWRPTGLVLDHGAGTGRLTERLAAAGVPVIAVDYSAESLRKLVARTRGSRVLAVQADVRALPLRNGVVSAAVSCELHEHIRGRDERVRALRELARVMPPGAPLAISSFNYNLAFRLWALKGNRGAREGEHLLGQDFYYVRQTRREFAGEVSEAFRIEELVGIRNIPARSVAGLIRRARVPRAADRFMDWMVASGWRLDVALERTPVSALTGLFWLAKAVRPSS
ncbi:MAG TPA: class I SAM-dependent methyltransferase [Candidatus Elarobacter sp.]